MKQLPMLERVEIVSRARPQYVTTDPAPQVVTLSQLQWMSLRCFKAEIPPILGFLKLPKLMSLAVDRARKSSRSPTFPIASFGKHLPNFIELADVEVCMCVELNRITFRTPSQAVLKYLAVLRSPGETSYQDDRYLWGDLPLQSVRKLVAIVHGWKKGADDVWLVDLLIDLGSLKHLEPRGRCGYPIRHLRRMMSWGDPLPGIKTVTVHSGESEIRHALELKDAVDRLGLGIKVTCIWEVRKRC